MLENISILTTFSLISLSVPGLANDINLSLIRLSQFDIIPAESLLSKLFDFPPDYERKPLNMYFDQFGFDCAISMLNLGSTFLYLVFVFLIFMLVQILRVFFTNAYYPIGEGPKQSLGLR